MKNTFLYKVWKNDKLLFGLFSLFIFFQVYFTYKGVESFPFVHWGMYSKVFTANENYTVYTLKIDTETVCFEKFLDPQKGMILGTISKYDALKKAQFYDSLNVVIDSRFKGKVSEEKLVKLRNTLTNDSAKASRYPAWLLGYVADMRLINNSSISVLKHQVSYDKNARLTTQSTDTLFNLNEN